MNIGTLNPMHLDLAYDKLSHCCTEKYGTSKKWMKDDYNIQDIEPKHISVFNKVGLNQLSGNPFGLPKEESKKDYKQFTLIIHQQFFKMEVITTSSKHLINGDLIHYVITANKNLVSPIKSEFEEILKLLSSREREVLILLANGHSMTSIAKILYLSPHTIDSHRMNLCAKLKVRRTTELAVWAHKLGLLTNNEELQFKAS